MARNHPDVIMVKRSDGTGLGFTFRSEEEFGHCAEAFLRPIDKTIEARLKENAHKPAPGNADELRLAATLGFLSQYLENRLEEMFVTDGLRWVAAACVRQTFPAGAKPEVVVIEEDEGKVGVRPGDEFLDHQGFPRAVIVGRPEDGGGDARFFDSAEAYAAAGQSTPTDTTWLPQIIYRLYESTPAVMMGLPVKSDESGGLGVECQGLAFGAEVKPVERPRA